MSEKSNWDYMTGILNVTAQAINNETDEIIKFTFGCYASPEINSYDRLDQISSIGYHMAELMNCHHAEIIDIEEVK